MIDIKLNIITETTKTITFGWTPPDGVQWYLFLADGKPVSNAPAIDKNGVVKNTIKFGKGPKEFKVQALNTFAEGVYPGVVPPPPPPPPPPTGSFGGTAALDLNGNRWPSGLSGNPSLVTVSADNAKDAASKFPHTLMYVDGPSIKKEYWTGVDYNWAVANNVIRPGSPSAYGAVCGDLANIKYQNQFILEVTTKAKAAGVFGIFIDDICYNVPGLFSGAYSTWQEGADAMLSFIHKVGPALMAAGYYVMINADGFVSHVGGDDGQLQIEWWGKLKGSAQAMMQECWMQNPNDYSQMRSGSWGYASDWLKLPKFAADNRIQFVGLTYGPSNNVESARAAALSAHKDSIVSSIASGNWMRNPTNVTYNANTGVGSLG